MKNNFIILAITGGIAAYKTCDLIRNLSKKNFEVQVLLTENAERFLTKLTLENLSGRKVFSNEWDAGMPHIEIKNETKLFAVVPATANIISKFANGIADDLISTTYLALNKNVPVVIAPAMNPNMYNHNATLRNLKTLRDDGLIIIEPDNGVVLCGDEGMGKMAQIELIEKIILENIK